MDLCEESSAKRSKLDSEACIIAHTRPSGAVKEAIINSTSTCQYFVERKKRLCKAPSISGKLYCAEHSYLSNDVDSKTKQDTPERKRIMCPRDPKHSCYEDQLQKHLRKCNARIELQPVYYEENINAGKEQNDENGKGESNKLTERLVLRNIPKEEVFDVIENCKTLFEKYEDEFSKKKILFHEALQQTADDPKNGPSALKHIKQQASIIGHMDRIGLLKDHHCYIEFGAGKGGLSHWVQKAMPSQNTQFVLVDKSSVRYKMDSYHKGTDQGPSFERLKIDIQHLNLDKVKNLDNDRPIISIGKHLCGNATDLMLRCMVNTLHEKDQYKRYIKGISLAMCCHHRCDWKSYVGKSFIKENNLSVQQFNIMCSMSSWAVCGNKSVEDQSYNHPYYGDLRPQDREEIGFKVKRLIELGRVRFLQDNGFDHVELMQFVEKDCSPEYMCLLATKGDYSVVKTTDNTSPKEMFLQHSDNVNNKDDIT